MNIEDIEKIWLTESAVCILTKDGREACEEFKYFPRLKWASADQRGKYEINHYGIHWPDLDEDLSFDGFFYERPKNRLYQIFMSHPELNASAIARRLGMAQSLLAQYISGSKKPSKEREESIIDEIRTVGSELQSIV